MNFVIHNELILHGLAKMHNIFVPNSIVTITTDQDNITLSCVDSRCMFECTIPSTSAVAGSCAVSLTTLYDLMRTSPGMWEFASNSQSLSLRYSKGSYELPITNEKFEASEVNYSAKWELEGKHLCTLIKEAGIASGNKIYQGIYFHYDTDNQCIAAVATDGVRMSCSRYHCKAQTAQVVLSKELCGLIAKWTERSSIAIHLGNAQEPVEFIWKHEDIQYKVRINSMQYKFPAYSKTIDSISSAQTIVVNGQDLVAALNRNSLFSNDQLRKVLLEPQSDKLTIRSSSINLGSGCEVIGAKCSSDIIWCVDSKMITDIAATNQDITIQGSAIGPIRLHTKPSWIYVFMPISQSRL